MPHKPKASKKRAQNLHALTISQRVTVEDVLDHQGVQALAGQWTPFAVSRFQV